MKKDFSSQKFYKDCVSCRGRGVLPTDSYCDTVMGIHYTTCDSCNGRTIVEFDIEELFEEEVENMKFNSRIVLELMKEELEARDLI